MCHCRKPAESTATKKAKESGFGFKRGFFDSKTKSSSSGTEDLTHLKVQIHGMMMCVSSSGIYHDTLDILFVRTFPLYLAFRQRKVQA